MTVDYYRSSIVSSDVTHGDKGIFVQVLGESVLTTSGLCRGDEVLAKRRSLGSLVINEGFVPVAEKKTFVEGKGKSISTIVDCKFSSLVKSTSLSPLKNNDKGASSLGMNLFVSRFGNSNAIPIGSVINANSKSFANINFGNSVDEVPDGCRVDSGSEVGYDAAPVFDNLLKEDGKKMNLWKNQGNIWLKLNNNSTYEPWIHVNYNRNKRGSKSALIKIPAQRLVNKKKLDNIETKKEEVSVEMIDKILEDGMNVKTMEETPSKVVGKIDEENKSLEMEEVEPSVPGRNYSKTFELKADLSSSVGVPDVLEKKNMFMMLQTIDEVEMRKVQKAIQWLKERTVSWRLLKKRKRRRMLQRSWRMTLFKAEKPLQNLTFTFPVWRSTKRYVTLLVTAVNLLIFLPPRNGRVP
ncbi:hypothetical protein MA16_Dca021787 [Dendrobium catenatum]|uniref:Uncharacterized protein n=1 Tax=Dendrobium catenatum TaxID=906689 RepID=A0A2I0WXV5_9ASPA|nr:hypothetical protein MA16_Dca021787 [Dendrobium catenatum]